MLRRGQAERKYSNSPAYDKNYFQDQRKNDPPQLVHSQDKRNTRFYLLRICLTVVVILLVAICTSLYFQQKEEFQRLELEQNELEKQMEALCDEYEDLNRQYRMSDSEEYIETIARDYLDLVRPGDIIIRRK